MSGAFASPMQTGEGRLHNKKHPIARGECVILLIQKVPEHPGCGCFGTLRSVSRHDRHEGRGNIRLLPPCESGYDA